MLDDPLEADGRRAIGGQAEIAGLAEVGRQNEIVDGQVEVGGGLTVIAKIRDDLEPGADVLVPGRVQRVRGNSPVVVKVAVIQVQGAVSSDLTVVRNPEDGTQDYIDTNKRALQALVEEKGAGHILNKVQAIGGHGGGPVVKQGTFEFVNLERFLRGEESGSTAPAITVDNLFEGVTMESPARTLWRAAILFAGRLPTQDELDAVQYGLGSKMREIIRGYMDGPAFHQFLIDGANDRLLTDRGLEHRVIDLASHEFVALNRKFIEALRSAARRGYEERWEDPQYRDWERAISEGAARAPIELIARVVENDLHYKEILTADYIMANPKMAEAYGASTEFENTNDIDEFKPSTIVDYYRKDDSKIISNDPEFDVNVVINSGNLQTTYPHAGILNTTSFLQRYPSTATNRNRARSRWTYYHFLGWDVEKSTQRTTDAAILADTDNPTMYNPACTHCHEALGQ